MIIVKIGGGEHNNYEGLAKDVAELYQKGSKIVVVSGGAERLDKWCAKHDVWDGRTLTEDGKPVRRTDAELMEGFREVYGEVRQEITQYLTALGIPAKNMEAADELVFGEQTSARYIHERKSKKLRDLSGAPTEIDDAQFYEMLSKEIVPVISPPILTMDRKKRINADGDTTASLIAREYKTDGRLEDNKLVLLTDQPGLLQDPNNQESLIDRVSVPEQLDQALEYAAGRMGKKVCAASDAVKAGVGYVVIGNGRTEQPLLSALRGNGTLFYKN